MRHSVLVSAVLVVLGSPPAIAAKLTLEQCQEFTASHTIPEAEGVRTKTTCGMVDGRVTLFYLQMYARAARPMTASEVSETKSRLTISICTDPNQRFLLKAVDIGYRWYDNRRILVCEAIIREEDC